jgi:hypothetical protein
MPTMKVAWVAAPLGQRPKYRWKMVRVAHAPILGEHKANVNSEEIYVLMEVQEEPVEGGARR